MADDEAGRLERLRAAEERLRAQVRSDDVSRRLAAIRHDIEMALSDIERTIQSTRRARGATDGDGREPDEPG